MGKLETFRKVLALPEVVQSIDLSGTLKELYTDHLELLEKNNELKDELRKLEEVSDIKKNAKIKGGYYTIDGVKDANGNELNFCLNCLYEHSLQIPMLFGIIERGVQDAYSGETFTPNTYGLTCNKCGINLAMSNANKGEK